MSVITLERIREVLMELGWENVDVNNNVYKKADFFIFLQNTDNEAYQTIRTYNTGLSIYDVNFIFDEEGLRQHIYRIGTWKSEQSLR